MFNSTSEAKYTGPTTAGWEYRYPGLTYPGVSASVSDMGATETIEWTEQFNAAPHSTSIDHLWYNHNTRRLTIRFKTGGLYSYDEFNLWNEFVFAPSLGQFYHKHFSAGGGWPTGAKHDQRSTKFKKVGMHKVQVESSEPDLDSLKPVKLTKGKGKRFELYFEYSGESRMEVRAESGDEAIATFVKYMKDHGFEAKVTGIYLYLED